jgi:HAD superfamily hydrolase (TIGR01484 family)
MRAALAGKASVARSQPYYLDITHPLANKGAALSELAKLLTIPLAEIAVIGDGGNDIAMFERCGLSIAMEALFITRARAYHFHPAINDAENAG